MIRMPMKFATQLAAFACAVAFCVSAHALVISADGVFNTFDIDDFTAKSGGLEWIDLAGNPLAFTFTTAGPVSVTVLDAGFAGDRFQILDNGSPVAVTAPATDTYPLALPSTQVGFAAAFTDARWSRAVITLSAGAHSITGLLSRSALDSGGVALNATVGGIRVVAVPEPGTWFSLLAGLLALFAAFASRRQH